MAIVRTAKGTATDKTGYAYLTISDIEVTSKASLLVCLAYDDSASEPVVRWGNRRLKRVRHRQANGVACSIFQFFRRKNTATRDLDVDWSTGTAPTAKAVTASQYTEVAPSDQAESGVQTASTTPGSGPAPLLTNTYTTDLFFSAFGSEGPVEDDVGTPQNGFLAGQRAGTTGGVADSNITVQEIYRIPDAIISERARLTGTTARDWAVCLAIFNSPNKAWKHTVTITGTYTLYNDSHDATTAEAAVEALTAAELNAVSLELDALTSVVVSTTVEQTDFIE